jgi:hypothetical protein
VWCDIEFAAAVVKLGKSYSSYKTAISENGLSGALLSSLSPEEIEAALIDVGVSNSLHRKAIDNEIKRLSGLPTAKATTAAAAAAPSKKEEFHSF